MTEHANSDIFLHDSLTRAQQALVPQKPGHVGLYVCGVTVYDLCHLGHARAMIVFDMLVRYLRSRGLKVTYVRNITDIDDKIIQRARETGDPAEAIAGFYTEAMRADEAALGLVPPDVEPAATDHVGDIVAMIETLIERGAAYVGDNGDVYYDVSQFADYGKLSGRRTADLRAGARVEINESKVDALDFALWKAAKAGEPSWDSPWGPGRPGWHIECSAMSTCCLGASFDIHGGGQDLLFPHHENEIAQSEAATGQPYAGLWMHNGFVTVDDEKMSKSLGNFWTIRDVLAEFDAESVRYFVLSTHYRSPLAYNRPALEAAESAMARLYTALRDAPTEDSSHTSAAAALRDRFDAAMADDLNTPAAIAVLFEMAREANRAGDMDAARAADFAAALTDCAGRIGLLQQSPERYLKSATASDALDAETVDRKLDERQTARAARDFVTADRIRDELTAAGIAIEDASDGTRWRRTGSR